MKQSKNAKKSLATAILALLLALIAAGVATFAWYIYNTRAHTTSVRMAAGAGVSLQISNKYEGPYGSSAVLDEFVGSLNPVSTNNILGGFQKVIGFTNGHENQPLLLANLFGQGEETDFYKTSLFFRTNGPTVDVYLANVGYEDSDQNNPISTAIRVGFVAHTAGENQPANPESMRIFAINDAKNPKKEYNTYTGEEGYVLDSSKTDGTTIPFTPCDSRNFCLYDSNTGATTLKDESLPLLQVSGLSGAGFGTPVQLDVYIWLEGCDEDCTNNLSRMTLQNLALSFAAYSASGGTFVSSGNDVPGANTDANTNTEPNANTEPATETIPGTNTEPTAEQSAEPTTEQSTQPTAEPAATPIAELAVEPTAEPTAEPSATPTAEP